MLRDLLEREQRIVCNPLFCKHLVDFWDLYGPCAEIAVVMRRLDQVPREESMKQVDRLLRQVVPLSDIDGFSSATYRELEADAQTVYSLILWVLMRVIDHTKPPHEQDIKECVI